MEGRAMMYEERLRNLDRWRWRELRACCRVAEEAAVQLQEQRRGGRNMGKALWNESVDGYGLGQQWAMSLHA